MHSDTLNPYALAQLADVASPDSLESDGARWLTRVADAARVMVDECREYGGDVADAIHETADALVPIYTHERWIVFVDLAAYNVEIDDYASGELSLTDLAGVALYVVAERLIAALVEDEDGER